MTKGSYPDTFYRVSIKAIIRDSEGRLLLVREKGHEDYALPGGGLGHGESAHDCLVRELYEELELTSPFAEHAVAARQKFLDSRNAYLLWVVYEIDYESLEFSVGTDAEAVGWFAPDEIITNNEEAKLTKSILENELA